jgi:hypothetical protein
LEEFIKIIRNMTIIKENKEKHAFVRTGARLFLMKLFFLFLLFIPFTASTSLLQMFREETRTECQIRQREIFKGRSYFFRFSHTGQIPFPEKMIHKYLGALLAASHEVKTHYSLTSGISTEIKKNLSVLKPLPVYSDEDDYPEMSVLRA